MVKIIANVLWGCLVVAAYAMAAVLLLILGMARGAKHGGRK